MKNYWQKMKFVAAAVGMTFLTGFAEAAVQTLTWSGTITDPINLPAGDTVVNWTGGVSVEGKISGPGRLILAATADATGRLDLNNDANDFSGGIVVQYGQVLLKPGAQGRGPICNTNETFDGRSFTAYNRPLIVIKAPTALDNEIRIGSEAKVGYNFRLVVTGTGDVAFNGPVVGTGGPSFGSVTVDGTGFSGTVTFCGGITDSSKFVINGVNCRIETTPVNVPALFIGTKAVTFAVPGNTVGRLDGWSMGKFVVATDNAFANAPNFEGQKSNPTGVILDVNGHDIVLGGHQGSDGWQTAPFSIENSDTSKTPTVTITQTADNPNSCLLTKGPMAFVKAGGAALSLTNDAFAFVGPLSVADGSLTLGFGEVAERGYLPDVSLSGGVLDLGGRTWICTTFAMTGGRLCNGLLVPSATSTVSGGEIRGGSLGGNWTKSGSGNVTVDAFSTTGCWHEASYTLPADTALFWSFDDVAAPWTENRVGGHTLAKTLDGGTVTQTGEGEILRGCAVDPNGKTHGAGLSLAEFPPEMPVDNRSGTLSIWFKMNQGAIDNAMEKTSGTAEYALWCYGEHGTQEAHTRMRGLNSMALQYNAGTGKWKIHNYLNYYNDNDTGDAIYCGAALDSFDAGWHNITVVLDDATDAYTIYYDGVQNNVASLKGMRPQAGIFKIGDSKYTPSWWGELDEFLVLNTARSADDVKALYDEGVTRQTARFDEMATVNLVGGMLNAPTDSLFHFSFDDADRPFADASVNVQTAILYGQPKQDADGRFGGCMRLNGLNEYLEVPYPQNLPRNGGAFTVSFWFNMDTDCEIRANMGYGLFGIGCRPASGNPVRYMSYETKIMDTDITPTDSSWYVHGYGETTLKYPGWRPVAPAKLMDGAWHHVVYAVDTSLGGDNTCLYVDGVLVQKLASTGFVWDENGSVVIGKSMYNGATFKGRLDDVVGWARQLSANEVAALYQAAAPSVPSLTVGEKMTLSVAVDVDVYGGLTFADGATLNGGNGALRLKGANLSFNGCGTLALAANPGTAWVTVATDIGALSAMSLANFRTWTVTWPGGSLPLAAANKVDFADGRLRIRLLAPGFMLLFR